MKRNPAYSIGRAPRSTTSCSSGPTSYSSGPGFKKIISENNYDYIIISYVYWYKLVDEIDKKRYNIKLNVI